MAFCMRYDFGTRGYDFKNLSKSISISRNIKQSSTKSFHSGVPLWRVPVTLFIEAEVDVIKSSFAAPQESYNSSLVAYRCIDSCLLTFKATLACSMLFLFRKL